MRHRRRKKTSSASTADTALTIFVVGSVVTLGLAFFLWEEGDRALAAGVILASPFPCPPGIPC